MGLFRQLIKTCLVWFVVLTLIVGLILFPRTISYTVDGGETHVYYTFSWEEYRENITGFTSYVWEHKSLGQTRYRYSVEFEVWTYLKRSLYVIITAFILSIIVGILKGIYDYRHTHSRKGIFGQGTTWLLQSIPDFFIVILFSMGVWFLWRIGFPKVTIYGTDNWFSFILPSIMVSIFPSMYLARITSANLYQQDKELYIQTAKAKGLSQRVILYKHALGNCWGVIFTHFSSLMLYILSNLLIVEYLLYYRGVAYRFYEALGYHGATLDGRFRHGPVIFEAELVIGFTLCFMLFVLFAQLISQTAKFYFDPRWRDES